MYFPQLLAPDWYYELRNERPEKPVEQRCGVGWFDKFLCASDCFWRGAETSRFDKDTQCLCVFRSKYDGSKYDMARNWRACK